MEGEICIDGLQWEVSSLVSGTFKLSEVTGKAEPIVLVIKSQVGQLAISTDRNLKLSYLDGELDYYSLRMKNIGHQSISQITLQTDFPLLFGWKVTNPDWTLKPGEDKEFKVYLRAGLLEGNVRLDTVTPRVLVRYCCCPATVPDAPAQYRYRRVEHVFSVEHSFTVKDQCIRSYKNLNEYLLNIQIEKIHAQNEAFGLTQLCVVGDKWKIVEKQQFTGFDKVFNTFLSLVHCPNESVSLQAKRILLGKNKDKPTEGDTDITCAEPYANYIKECQEVRQNNYTRESLMVTTVDILATWTLELGKQAVHGVHLVPITLSSYNSSMTVSKGPSKLDIFPLQIVHECPSVVRHDFSTEPYLYRHNMVESARCN